MTVSERLVAAQSDLSPAETRVAAVVLGAPADVAFGTVAALARAAGTGAATVVRFTTKLGYRGFADLRASVRAELSESLRPAAERIREPAAHDVVHLGRRDLENDEVGDRLQPVHRARPDVDDASRFERPSLQRPGRVGLEHELRPALEDEVRLLLLAVELEARPHPGPQPDQLEDERRVAVDEPALLAPRLRDDLGGVRRGHVDPVAHGTASDRNWSRCRSITLFTASLSSPSSGGRTAATSGCEKT